MKWLSSQKTINIENISNLQTIVNEAFSSCSSLICISYEGINIPTCKSNVFTDTNINKITVNDFYQSVTTFCDKEVTRNNKKCDYTFMLGYSGSDTCEKIDCNMVENICKLCEEEKKMLYM